MGGYATQLIAEGRFGHMVALQGNSMGAVPLTEVAGKLKLVTEDNDLVRLLRILPEAGARPCG